MRHVLSAGAIALAILCASCAGGYEPAGPPTTHPANPAAPQAPPWRLPPTLDSSAPVTVLRQPSIDEPGQPPRAAAGGHGGHAMPAVENAGSGSDSGSHAGHGQPNTLSPPADGQSSERESHAQRGGQPSEGDHADHAVIPQSTAAFSGHEGR